MLQLFVKAYNNTIQTALEMVPAVVTDKHLLEIWTRMNEKRSRVRVGRVKFKVGQHVRISKEKMNFEKGSEHNYTEEIFRMKKVNCRTPSPL